MVRAAQGRHGLFGAQKKAKPGDVYGLGTEVLDLVECVRVCCVDERKRALRDLRRPGVTYGEEVTL